MKKALRFLLGVFVLTMLWTTPTYAATFQEGANYVSYDGEIKSVLIINGNWVTKPAGTWYEYNYNKYYFIEDGFLAFKEIVTIDGKKYFFDEYSVLRTGSFTTKVKNPDSNSDSYKAMLADENGVLYDPGWYVMGDGHTYYINEENFMAWNEIQTINGKRYSFDINKRLEYGHIVVSSEDSEKEYYTATDENGAFIEVRNAWYECSYGWGRDHKHYVDEKGYFLADDVYEIDGLLYEFDETGRLITQVSPNTGWFQQGYGDFGRPIWYYRGEDGKLLKSGIYEINGKKYYFDDSGVMGTGILYVQDKSVYMLTDENGAIYEKVGWFYTGGYWYYFYQDHTIAVNGLYTINGKTYYFDQTGKMKTGWILTDNGDVLGYGDSSGALQTGWVYVDNSWYYVNADYTRHHGWLTVNGATYYLDKVDGRMVENGVHYADGIPYKFDKNGGVYKKTGWTQIDGSWYYFNEDGSIIVGWMTIDGKKYYFDEETGQMATGRIAMSGKRYYFDSNGALYDEVDYLAISDHLDENNPKRQRMIKIWEVINKYVDPNYHLNVRKEYLEENEYAEIQAKAKEVTANCPTQFEKIRAIAKYVADNTYYETGCANNGAYEVFKEKRAVCAGYAALTEAMMQSIGIPCMELQGSNHAFNAAYDSEANRWIVIDADASSDNACIYNKSTKEYEFYYLGSNENYFDLTPGQIAATQNHEIYSIHGLVDANGKWYRLACTGNLDEWVIHPSTDNDETASYSYEEWIQKDNGIGWIQNGTGWRYRDADGTYTKNCWKMINGKWYAFKSNGYMREGWFYENGTWYYLKPGSGHMLIGWQYINGTWYYMKSSGAMATGWQYIDGSWYYLKSSGAMATGWQYVGGSWYYLESSGVMATGWQYIDGSWYYLKSNGVMATGWIQDGGKKYYLNASGVWVS